MKQCYSLYTDGGCSGNPGIGAWAFCLVNKTDSQLSWSAQNLVQDQGTLPFNIPPQVFYFCFGGAPRTTNNQMELQALIQGFTYLLEHSLYTVEVLTDSQYAKDGIEKWIHNWKRNQWRTSARQAVKNQELWKELDLLHAQLAVRWAWVKGHSGNLYNEFCDQLVKFQMEKIKG